MEAMKQVVSETYYLSHFMAFFSYFVVRSSAAAVLSPHIIHHLFYREIQAVLALSLLAAIKITREETWEEFIDNMLFYAKVITSESFFASSGSYCINNGLPFGSLVSGGFFRYSNKNVSFGIVDLGLFPNAAEKFGISLGGKLLTARSNLFIPMFFQRDIPLRSMGQLPTYILFENNAEINRFPAFGFEEKFSHPHITKKLIAHHFQLDRLRIESVHGD
ncbi:thioredoxin-related transmembrane protein 2 [Citrus sinensis]|uniref:Thioredoxin-related transmembrane protein 2 n=1 Tax=Citrus sinensis TaxID=2711 RepID=A0ACB8NP82_CITSI|nr:thioredoxin-related transmembrane protein 2 [Citrus sinensis]